MKIVAILLIFIQILSANSLKEKWQNTQFYDIF